MVKTTDNMDGRAEEQKRYKTEGQKDRRTLAKKIPLAVSKPTAEREMKSMYIACRRTSTQIDYWNHWAPPGRLPATKPSQRPKLVPELTFTEPLLKFR